MKILLLGKNGQVGWDLQRTLEPLGDLVAMDRASLDLTDKDSLRRRVREHHPRIIVNATAYTAVDRAETEQETAMAVNGTAPGVLAEEARRLGALLIHYSTDYVFDGSKTGAYVEEDIPNPINVYGKTKLAGERAIQSVGGLYLLFRTSWVYSHRGENFFLKILQLAKQRERLTIVADQIGAPTSSHSIARATADVCSMKLGLGNTSHEGAFAGRAQEYAGIYHMSASGETSWCGFAQAIVGEALKMGVPGIIPSLQIAPITSDEYPTPAPRPKNSILSNRKLNEVLGTKIDDWSRGIPEVLRLALETSKG